MMQLKLAASPRTTLSKERFEIGAFDKPRLATGISLQSHFPDPANDSLAVLSKNLGRFPDRVYAMRLDTVAGLSCRRGSKINAIRHLAAPTLFQSSDGVVAVPWHRRSLKAWRSSLRAPGLAASQPVIDVALAPTHCSPSKLDRLGKSTLGHHRIDRAAREAENLLDSPAPKNSNALHLWFLVGHLGSEAHQIGTRRTSIRS